jgi:hypothetical protein
MSWCFSLLFLTFYLGYIFVVCKGFGIFFLHYFLPDDAQLGPVAHHSEA